jgi:hypothetical protein
MNVIFSTHSSDEHYNSDCDYAVVDLTPALADQIRRQAELAKQAHQQDEDLHQMSFWSGAARYFDHTILDACQDAIARTATDPNPDQGAREWLTRLEQCGYAVIPGGVDLDTREARHTECGLLLISCNTNAAQPGCEIAWTAVPKHTDISITTSELAVDTLLRLLAATLT